MPGEWWLYKVWESHYTYMASIKAQNRKSAEKIARKEAKARGVLWKDTTLRRIGRGL